MPHPLLFGTLFLLLAAAGPAAAQDGVLRDLIRIPGPTLGAEMGASVADAGDLDGDGISDILVGAPGAGIPPASADTGTVLVYSGADQSLLLQFYGSAPGDRFGNSVAGLDDLDGDGIPEILVGAFYTEVQSLQRVGRAYVYSGADGSLLRQYEGGEEFALFGSVVADVGDLDADGISDYGIASWEDVGGYLDGMVYLYSGASGHLLYRFEEAYSRLGASMDAAGDLDGDGHGDVLLGAPHGGSFGRVEVRSGRDGSILKTYLPPFGFRRFGFSVAHVGDWDGDGRPDYAIGDPQASVPLDRAGMIQVLSGHDGTVLMHQAGPKQDAELGFSMTGGKDVDGDGIPDLLVGAVGLVQRGSTRSGAAFLYSGASRGLTHRIAAPASEARIGSSVAFAGDADADGILDMVAGASRQESLYGPPGDVILASLATYLSSDRATLSAATGGWWELGVDFPTEFAGYRYRILFSATGPGPNFYGVEIPLTLDLLLLDSYARDYPFRRHQGLEGILDSEAKASGRLYLPRSALASAVGQQFWVAAVAHEVGELPAISSSARVLTVVD